MFDIIVFGEYLSVEYFDWVDYMFIVEVDWCIVFVWICDWFVLI